VAAGTPGGRRHLTEVPGVQVEPPQENHEVLEDRDHLVRLLGRLTERERKVVVLRHYFDLAEVTVAAELGVSVGTVKSTSSKALAKLRSAPAAATVRRGT
jgi:RNA polymerase sigma factor (sigma-70 family)